MTFDRKEWSKQWRNNHPDYAKNYYLNNKDAWLERYGENKKELKQYSSLYRTGLKIITLQIYSNGKMKCAKCDCDDIDVLDLDHIENDGYKERKSTYSLFLELQRMNYPNGYQVLCRNCNWKKFLDYQDSLGGD